MPGSNDQSAYEIYVMNFTEPTNFPFTVAIYAKYGSQPIGTIDITGNGVYMPSGMYPGLGRFTISLTQTNTSGEPILEETVVLSASDALPPLLPTSSRYIRVVVRNVPIVGEGNGEDEQ